MRKTTCFLVSLVIFAACTNGNQKDGNNKQQTAYKTTANAYLQAPVAYLIDGELFFHNFERNTIFMIDIFDTHAHYDDEAFDEDREQLLADLPLEDPAEYTALVCKLIR